MNKRIQREILLTRLKKDINDQQETMLRQISRLDTRIRDLRLSDESENWLINGCELINLQCHNLALTLLNSLEELR